MNKTVDFRNNTIKNWRNALRAARRVEKDPQAEGEWETSYRNYAAAGGKSRFLYIYENTRCNVK